MLCSVFGYMPDWIRGHKFDPGLVPYFRGERKYVHKVLVNRLVKLAQEKSVVR